MQSAGMKLIYHLDRLSFMGFLEVVRHLPFIREVGKKLEHELETRRPDVAVLIDYPGFNLRFARTLKKHGIPVIYYISPQVWAWAKYRVKKIQKFVDTMLVILPFEVDFFAQHNIEAEFVGHPLLDVLRVTSTKAEFMQENKFDPRKKILAIFPGSRKQEIFHLLPEMVKAARIVRSAHEVQIAVSKAPNLPIELLKRVLGNAFDVTLVEGQTYDLMRYADIAIVKSGTATLETACFATPMVVVYKTSALSYLIGRMLVSVDYVGLVNIVAGKRIVPELIQHDANAEAIAVNVLQLLNDQKLYSAVKKELALVKGKLGTPGAAGRVAEKIFSMAAQ